MKHKKILSVALALAMVCTLLSGCVYVKTDSVIHDDGTGSVYTAFGMQADEGAAPEEGQEVFEANGNKYYGSSETVTFASVEEFNKIFSSENADSDSSAAASAASSTVATLRKNSDGSLTLVFSVKQSEDEDEAALPDYENLDPEQKEALESIELTPEEEAELENLDLDSLSSDMMEGMYYCMSFTFDQPVRQIAGPTSAVTIEGGKVTLDLTKQGEGDANDAYVFVTDVASKVAPTKQALKVDGTARETEIYNINGANYFKLRDMAALLNGTGAQFSVDFDKASNTISVKTGESYTVIGGELTVPAAEQAAEKAGTAVKSAQKLTINGESAYLAPYNIGGQNYFALRDLDDALGFGVDYDAATKTMLVTTGK